MPMERWLSGEKKYCSRDHVFLDRMLGINTYLGLYLADKKMTIADFSESTSPYQVLSNNAMWNIVYKGISHYAQKRNSEETAMNISFAVNDIDSGMRWLEKDDFDWRLLFSEKENPLSEYLEFRKVGGLRAIMNHFEWKKGELVTWVENRLDASVNGPSNEYEFVAKELKKALERYRNSTEHQIDIKCASRGWKNVIENIYKYPKRNYSSDVSYWMGRLFFLHGYEVDYRFFLPVFNSNDFYIKKPKV